MTKASRLLFMLGVCAAGFDCSAPGASDGNVLYTITIAHIDGQGHTVSQHVFQETPEQQRLRVAGEWQATVPSGTHIEGTVDQDTSCAGSSLELWGNTYLSGAELCLFADDLPAVGDLWNYTFDPIRGISWGEQGAASYKPGNQAGVLYHNDTNPNYDCSISWSANGGAVDDNPCAGDYVRFTTSANWYQYSTQCMKELSAVSAGSGGGSLNGEVYGIGCGSGDQGIYQGTSSGWVQLSGAASHIAAGHYDGTSGLAGVDLAVVNNSGTQYFYQYSTSSFVSFQNPGCATSIDLWTGDSVASTGTYGFYGVGAQWITGCSPGPSYNIYSRSQASGYTDSPSTTWTQTASGQLTKVAVLADTFAGHSHTLWGMASNGNIYTGGTDGSSWSQVSGCATDIGAGADQVYVIGCTKDSHNNYELYNWSGSSWTDTGVAGVHVSVGKSDDSPWIIDSNGVVFFNH